MDYIYIFIVPLYHKFLKINIMRKIILVVTVTILGMNILKAQEPWEDYMVQEIKTGWGLLFSDGYYAICTILDKRIACTKHKTLLYNTTDRDAFSFDKPIYTSQIGSFCGEDFYLYASGVEAMKITRNGNVGIGVSQPSEKLVVDGMICAKEVRVSLAGAPCWPDFVFAKDYSLMSLSEIEQYIKLNQHLPDIPAAIEIEENGIQLGEINVLLLKKIEELTLYIIDLQKQIDELKSEKQKGGE
jgi:hypothetical protein